MNMLRAVAYYRDPDDATKVVAVIHGQMGYRRIDVKSSPEDLNRAAGLTKAEVAAMLTGSMFGWGCKGADPKSYDEDGKPIVKDGSCLI